MKIAHKLASTFFAAVLVALGSAAQAAPVQWDMANEYGASTLMGQADQKFAEILAKESNGRVEVVNHYGGALGFESKDMLTSVGTGAVTLGNFPIQSAAGVDPLLLVSNLPFLVSDAEQAFTLQDVMRPYLEKIFAARGAKLLYLTNWPSVGIWSSEPARSLADLKGEKIRTNDVMATKFFKKAGALPLQISWTDVIPQLQAGALSMVHTSSAGGISVNMGELLPAYTDVGMMMSANAAIMNLATYRALNDATKAAVDAAARKTEAWFRKQFINEIARDEATMKAHGVKVLSVDDIDPKVMARYRQLSEPLIVNWLNKTGDNGKALLDAYLKKTGRSLDTYLKKTGRSL